MNEPDENTSDAPDVAELLAYMERKNLSRMELTIEAVSVPSSAEGLEATPAARLAVAERNTFTDDSVPSDLGLDGVFIVVRVV